MLPMLLATLRVNDFWYALPLVVAISLVYAASRHEQTGLLLHHAARIALWIVGFMAALFVILMLLSWWA